MAQFKFKLEKVLEYREQLKEQAMQALAEATSRRNAVLRHLEDLRAALAEHRLKLLKRDCAEHAERWLLGNYIKGLEADIAYAEKMLAILEEEVDKAREALIIKSQEYKLLEHLKEKQAQRHAQEENLKEQRSYDETATIRFRPQAV